MEIASDFIQLYDLYFKLIKVNCKPLRNIFGHKKCIPTANKVLLLPLKKERIIHRHGKIPEHYKNLYKIT